MKLPKLPLQLMFFRSLKFILGLAIIAVAVSSYLSFYFYSDSQNAQQIAATMQQNLVATNQKVTESSKRITELESRDEFKINKTLEDEVDNINRTYTNSINLYEKIVDLKSQKQDTTKHDTLYAKIVKLLSDKNYASASATITDLDKTVKETEDKLATTKTAAPSTENLTQSNTPPNSGFSVQAVSVDGQTYRVAIIAGDLNSTKVVVDTASESDCRDNCPTLSLSDYVSRNGAWAGINGTYFCPGDYPSCAGKTNSFDTLLMNKNKKYFNSDNNVYSTIPAAIFSSGSARFVSQSLEWGRDTGVDSVIANYPLLVAGNNINFTEAPNEPKFGGKAARTFIAHKGNLVYIGIVYGASMGESAKVLHAMGMNAALNLDQGGSTALWHGGYKAGPGRGLPNAVLFVKR